MDKISTFSNLGNESTHGRLGNQLIQISSLIKFSELNKTHIFLKNWKYKNIIKIKKEIKWDDCNSINYKIINNNNYLDTHTEKNFNLNDFFQDINLFEYDFNKIFEFSDEIKLLKIKSENTCAIHFRRTDYVNHPSFVNLDENYYNNAIDIIGNDKEYHLFSDDIEYGINFFKKRNLNYVIHKNIDIVDLYLMSLCENKILANSTFSLTSAYFNNINKIVSPKIWHKNNYKINLNLKNFIEL